MRVDAAPGRRMLRWGAWLSAIGAALHLAALVLGGPWYRTMGAGEQIARLAEHGHWYPPVATLLISAILLVWAAYALSGAGLVRRLPLLRTVLAAVTAVYLLRGVAGLVVLGTRWASMQTTTFWICSSLACLGFGVVHAAGLRQAWPRLSSAARAARAG